ARLTTTFVLAEAVAAESPLFNLDTQFPTNNGSSIVLLAQTDSALFTLDTLLTEPNPALTNLMGSAVSAAFTLDSRIPPPTRVLTRLDIGNTGGKIRFSPDGLRLAKTDGSKILLWNLQSIQSATTFSGYGALIDSVDFSP